MDCITVSAATRLYDSRTKFESGTGWPSFWQPKSKHNIAETTDRSYGMIRTAVSCRAAMRTSDTSSMMAHDRQDFDIA